MDEIVEREHDWLFDLMTEYLGSAEFSAAVLDFVDERCEVFKNEDENKLEYTEIHNEFKDYVEMLISSKLAEVSICSSTLVEACTTSKHARSINMEVFNRLIALEDFLYFKKMMVKRNAELELEALQEMQGNLQPRNSNIGGVEGAKNDEVGKSILELSIMHRQEEIEQMALEQAIALSLSLSQTTSSQSHDKKQTDSKSSKLELLEDDHTLSTKTCILPTHMQQKRAAGEENSEKPAACSTVATAAEKSTDSVRLAGETKHSSHHSAGSSSNQAASAATLPEPKRLLQHVRSLPPLAGRSRRDGRTFKHAPLQQVDSFNPAQLHTNQLRAAERLLTQQRSALESDRQAFQSMQAVTHPDSKVDHGEERSAATPKSGHPDQRAQHLRALRDQLVAKKKQERQEQFSSSPSQQQQRPHTMVHRRDNNDTEFSESCQIGASSHAYAADTCSADRYNGKTASSSDGGLELCDANELRRHAVGMMLARRLKCELFDAEHQRLQELQNGHLQLLDKHVQLIEMLREQSERKQQELKQAMRQHQVQVGSNIVQSRRVAEDGDLDLK